MVVSVGTREQAVEALTTIGINWEDVDDEQARYIIDTINAAGYIVVRAEDVKVIADEWYCQDEFGYEIDQDRDDAIRSRLNAALADQSGGEHE